MIKAGKGADLPKVLKYPTFIGNDKLKHVKNMLCYVIKDYGTDGVCILLTRNQSTDEVIVLCGDWNGNNLDLQSEEKGVDIVKQIIGVELAKIANIMRLINIPQAQFFFSTQNGYRLVDMQIALNKFVGPGMIRDLFGNIIKTQEMMKVEPIDERSFQAIIDGQGSYSGNLIIKPSKFRMIEQDGNYSPLYLRYTR